MEIFVESITDKTVVLRGLEKNYRGCYNNTSWERVFVENLLTKNGCANVWTESILPIWTDTNLIPDPQIDYDELRTRKINEIKTACHTAIVEGFDIDLGLTEDDGQPLGELHYSLSESTQTTMRNTYELIQNGAKDVTWRDDSRVSHMIYTAQQFTDFYNAANKHIVTCRLRSDALEHMITEAANEDLQNINWNTELTESAQAEMNKLLAIYGF